MYQQNSITFLRDFAELLLKYGLTLEQIKAGRFMIGNDEIVLDRLKFSEQHFEGTIIANVGGFFAERLPDPKPVYVYDGDNEKHRCVYCGSSLRKIFWKKRSQFCINPECHNYYDPKGFQVIMNAKKANQETQTTSS